MHYHLTSEQQEMIDKTRKIALEKILPIRAQYDIEGGFPWEVVEALADAGLFKVFIPEKNSGIVGEGYGVTNMCLVTEELSRVCGGIALAFAGTGLGSFPILLFGNEEQKQKFLSPIARGEKLAAFGLTEPDAGSDAGSIKTTAKKDGDSYILNGNKIFITNGGEADIYTVLALTAPEKGARGASMFIVEKGTPGFDFGRKEDKMGIRGSVTKELIFDNAKIPAENLLGKEGYGFIIAMRTFDTSRPGVAAQALGIAQGAFDEIMKYAYDTHHAGTHLLASQGIQWMMADMSASISAARALIYQVAELIDEGKAKEVSHLSAMAKMFASDVAMKVSSEAVQILGGSAYTHDVPLEKMMRDAKITQIYEGTNQIQRDIIGGHLLKEAGKIARRK